jgi:hypothetical protein
MANAEFKEHDYLKEQKQNKEYITPVPLREFTYKKFTELNIKINTIFDGAIGSGQLLQYFYKNIKALKVYGNDINANSVNLACQNFNTKNIKVDNFFNTSEYINNSEYDFCLSNYPFSLTVKDLEQKQIHNILTDKDINYFYNGKITGNLDYLFIIKMFLYSKRYSLFLAYPGLTYRTNEKKFREYLNDYVVELGILENAGFDNTNISLLFLLLDKQKQKQEKANTFRYDFKENKYTIKEQKILNADNWELPAIKQEQEKIDIIKLNKQIEIDQKKRIDNDNKRNRFLAETFPNDFPDGYIWYYGVRKHIKSKI